MKETFFDISKKIDPLTKSAIMVVDRVARRGGIRYFIVGATVRDLILNYVYNIRIYRLTNDLDFAINLGSWDEYFKLTAEIEKQGFKPSESIMHRFSYQDYVIDFIPFGEISTEDEKLVWPDRDKRIMDIVGFRELSKSIEKIRISENPDVIVNAASVKSLTVLKLFAWNGRTADIRKKDAKDLYLILSTYIDAGNFDRLMNEENDIIDDDFDYNISGARLLGRDIAPLLKPATRDFVLQIISGEKQQILAKEMSDYEGIFTDKEEAERNCIEMLNSLYRGINEIE